MEDEVFDEIDDNYGYLSCVTSAPYKTLSTVDGCHEYGAFLWPTWLSENFGHDLTRRIQECAGSNGIFSCLEGELAGVGTSFEDAFADFWTWNFYTGVRDDGLHYQEGSAYDRPVAYDRALASYPQIDQRPTGSLRPESLGASVLRLRPAQGTDNLLTIEFRGPTCTQRVILIQKKIEGNVFIEHYFDLQSDRQSTSTQQLVGTLDVKDWDATEYAQLFVITNRSLGSGAFDYSIDVESSTQAAGIGDHDGLYTRTVVLDQNEPNPFRGFTQIRYALAEAGPVRLEIFDAAGRVVRTLLQAIQDAGVYPVSWDGRDDAGRRVEPGVYFYRVQARGSSDSKKMILMKD
jgi:hypothetical protein